MNWWRTYMVEDGGGAGAGGDAGAGTPGAGDGGSGAGAGDGGGQPATPPRPSWFSQMSREEEKDYGSSLNTFTRVGDLAKAYVDLKNHPVEKAGAVYVPDDKSTPEQVKAFKDALGIPEDGKYDLTDDGSMYTKDGAVDEGAKKAWDQMKEQVAKLAKDGNMSKAQAQQVWNHQIAFLKAGLQAQAGARENLQKTFGARTDNLYRKDWPNDTERKEAIRADIAVVRRSLEGMPKLKQAMENTGVLLDPSVMREMAQYLSSIGAGNSAGGGGQGGAPEKKHDGNLTFRPEFYEHIKEIKSGRL